MHVLMLDVCWIVYYMQSKMMYVRKFDNGKNAYNNAALRTICTTFP